VPTLPLQSPAQPNLGSDTNCQDQPSALLPINRTVSSFADHLRGDVRNACSHSSPAVALLNQNELATRTMNIVWVVLRSTSFYFFIIYGEEENTCRHYGLNVRVARHHRHVHARLNTALSGHNVTMPAQSVLRARRAAQDKLPDSYFIWRERRKQKLQTSSN
jgi:hypothetical protein